MADKNHVRALVHATGDTMKWALGYYNAYHFEISKSTVDDMTIDDVVDLSVGNAAVTFTDVLQAMLDASTAGFSEIMIVAHGSAKGLIMPMGPALHSADKDNLPSMTELAEIMKERDRIGALSDSKQQVTDWLKLLRRLSGSMAAGGAKWGTMTSDNFDSISSDADGRSWLETISPTVNGQSILLNKASVALLDLRNKVVAKKFKRVEVRACNLGGDSDGMKALREFLGVSRVLAPMVKTFYGHVNPTLFPKDSDYLAWVRRNAPWELDSHSAKPANAATYTGDDLFLKMDDKAPTPLSVLKIWQPSFQTCAGITGKNGNFGQIKALVRDNFDVKDKSGYQSGAFFIGGLDPVAGRTQANPPPAAANGKPFVVASEPEYRALIVSNP